jgi:hypothetical protein
MMNFAFANAELLALVLALCTAAGGFVAGTSVADNACAAAQAKQLQAALQAQQAATTRGDVLTRSLLQQQSQIDVLKLEAHRAITQATTGRTCLGGAALRVLNSAPGITVDLPAPASSAAAAGGAVSTDTDIALWVADTGAAYDVCRARLDALIDWHTIVSAP